jgi:hypothetical protein
MYENRNNIHQDYQRCINYSVNLNGKSSIQTTHLDNRIFTFVFKLEIYDIPAVHVHFFFSCGIGLTIKTVACLQLPTFSLSKVVLD